MTATRRSIVVSAQTSIPLEELRFTFEQASGPGGQNVNKVATRVVLHFDVLASPSLTDSQKQRILLRLRKRISRQGVLRVVSSTHRTQPADRRAAVERFARLITEALTVAKPRKRTRVPIAARRRRREEKTRRSVIKQQRRARPGDDG